LAACPHCGKGLTVKLEKGKNGNRRPAKDPNEPMTAETFIKGCRDSAQRHINLVGEWADELQTEEYTTRGQWGEFLKRNVRAAKKLEVFTDDQIGNAMKEIDDATYINKVTLETVYKFLVK